jgi:sugar lactone lactonase YvrE
MPRRRILPIALAIVVVLVIVGGALGLNAWRPAPLPAEAFGTGPDGLPDIVEFTSPNYGPEGVEWDAARGRFIVGSLTFGTVSAVADDGTLTPLVADARFLSTAGLQIDAPRDRLLVTNSQGWAFVNPFITGQAGLGIYSLATGEPIAYADFTPIAPEGARLFANDVAVDADGNAYVTNSFAPLIFRVSVTGEPSVFVTDERLGGGFIGLNGIEAHPDGFLLAAVAGMDRIVRIPLDDPAALSIVEVDRPVGGDGMLLLPDGDLLVVAGREGVHRLRSADGWATAETVRVISTLAPATTAALRDGVPYVLFAYLTNPTAERYQIARLALE